MNNNIFRKFPIIESDRLYLRRMTIDDAPEVFKFNSNIETLKYVPRTPFTQLSQGIEKTQYFINLFDKQEAIWWAITIKNSEESNKLIGYCGLFDIDFQNRKAEIGYGLLKPYWGKQIASEVVKNLTSYGFCELNLHRIFAKIDPKNIASQKVVEKIGFTKEGILKDDAFERNQYFDMTVYAKINLNNFIPQGSLR